jgi:hypothetical protein
MKIYSRNIKLIFQKTKLNFNIRAKISNYKINSILDNSVKEAQSKETAPAKT